MEQSKKVAKGLSIYPLKLIFAKYRLSFFTGRLLRTIWRGGTVLILVLSGGGLWSAAGVGAAAALRDMDIRVEGYVGTSAGAWVAAALAAGRSPEWLSQAAASLNAGDFRLDWHSWIREALRGRAPLSLFDGSALSRRLAFLWQGMSWETLNAPLWVTVTSLARRRVVVFGSYAPPQLGEGPGDLVWGGCDIDLMTALQASVAVPGLFPPVVVGGDWFVDGGVGDDYPLDVATWVGASHLVGVWVDESPTWSWPRRYHGGHVMTAALEAMIRQLTLARQRLIHVPRVDVRIQMDGGHRIFGRVAEIIQRGYDATWASEEQIRGILR